MGASPVTSQRELLSQSLCKLLDGAQIVFAFFTHLMDLAVLLVSADRGRELHLDYHPNGDMLERMHFYCRPSGFTVFFSRNAHILRLTVVVDQKWFLFYTPRLATIGTLFDCYELFDSPVSMSSWSSSYRLNNTSIAITMLRQAN